MRWARGPFELMNRVGVLKSFEMAQDYLKLCQDESGKSNWQIPEFFANQASEDKKWDFSYVDTEISNGIATITINRPEAMNALNETVIHQLGNAVDAVNSNDEVHTMVLDGAGKAFIAGADVKFFVDKIRSDSIPDIVEFTSNGHKVLNSIENSPKTTIALTTGLALGGGLELALCCDYIELGHGEHNSASQKHQSAFTLVSAAPSARPESRESRWRDGRFWVVTS